MPNIMSKNKILDAFDAEELLSEDLSSEDLPSEDYAEIFKDAKKELLLENRRARVTTMSFHDWFAKKYQREFKPSDKFISDAYHAGASDEIENNAYLAEHADLKMNHYKAKANRFGDQVQILYLLLDTLAKKTEIPDPLKKLVRKVLSEQP